MTQPLEGDGSNWSGRASCFWWGILAVTLQLLDGWGVTTHWEGRLTPLYRHLQSAVLLMTLSGVMTCDLALSRATHFEILSLIISTFVIFLHFYFVLVLSREIFFLTPFVSWSLPDISFLFDLRCLFVSLSSLFLNLACSFVSISCYPPLLLLLLCFSASLLLF